MNIVLSGLRWTLRASIFIALLAFALNNTHIVNVQLFFGRSWQAPLVLLVLVCFSTGLLLGIVGMLYSTHFSKHRTGQTGSQNTALTVGTAPTVDAAGDAKSLTTTSAAP